jgi:SpoVK/Ycf46/Vps4 family AAA+-type ATPase
MFREAELENAVLLLDEADSYLQDRKQAKRSWEISEVNEMLTQMESFDGLFIASTNLMSSLDAAALRRFDLKLRFDYLKPEQAWLMFTDTITKLGLQLDESLQKAVAALGMLTPGDFAAVTRQSRLRKIADSSDLLNRLTDECAIKPDANKRAIGFSAY